MKRRKIHLYFLIFPGVLLSALSDTLTEHPEFLPAARVNLANPFYRLPIHAPSQ